MSTTLPYIYKKPTFSLRTKKKCPQCRIQYQIKHTCPGRGHRKDFNKLLKSLDSDQNDLMMLIAFLGGKVPLKLLDRLRTSKLIWGNGGDVQLKAYGDVPVVADESRFKIAIQVLKEGTILSTAEAGLLSIAPELRQRIITQTSEQNCWKLQALMAVMHAFPEHRHLEPAFYFATANSLLPHLQHVLTYVGQQAVSCNLDSSQTSEIVNVCLSSSCFLNMGWKENVLGVAEGLLTLHGQTCSRIQLRRMALARISMKQSETQIDQVRALIRDNHPHDKRSNAHFAEMLLFEARLLVDLERHSEALSVLSTFKARDPWDISKLEQIQLSEIAFLRGLIDRYEGNFIESRVCFLQLLGQLPSPPKIMTQLSAVSCEIGNFPFAIASLIDELKSLERSGYPKDGQNVRRLQLSLAEAYLMSAVKLVASQWEDINEHKISLQALELIGKAREQIEVLRRRLENADNLQKAGIINRFRVFLAAAIAEHLAGDPLCAVARWNEALEVSHTSWPDSYSDMIIAYSKADLMYRLGEQVVALDLEQFAFKLHSKTRRRYHFTGFGTIWLEYMGISMRVRHGRLPLYNN